MISNIKMSMPAGDTLTLKIPLNVDAPPAFDPTGATGTWTLAKAAASTGADILLTKTTTDGGASFQQDADGLWWIWVPLAEDDTATRASTTAYFQTARVNEANGGRFHVMSGTLTVTAVPDP
jgi:hypothetical protein